MSGEQKQTLDQSSAVGSLSCDKKVVIFLFVITKVLPFKWSRTSRTPLLKF